MNIDITKYAPFFIAGLVVLLALLVHRFVPDSPIDKEVETVAEQVVKDETGFNIPLPEDNSSIIVQKSA